MGRRFALCVLIWFVLSSFHTCLEVNMDRHAGLRISQLSTLADKSSIMICATRVFKFSVCGITRMQRTYDAVKGLRCCKYDRGLWAAKWPRTTSVKFNLVCRKFSVLCSMSFLRTQTHHTSKAHVMDVHEGSKPQTLRENETFSQGE